jgi:Putative auto-transporter adhesin, head GIN domain
MTRYALALFSAVSMFGCHVVEGGPETSETRTLEAFTRVRLEDGIPAKWSPGASQVVINTQQKVLENLKTDVKDGTLVISLKSGVIVESFDSTEILITGASVVSLEATGASSLTATGVDASPLRVTASGASQVKVSGTSGDVRINASGASSIDSKELISEVASVDASGASLVSMRATKSVDGSVSGASHVTVFGGGQISNVSTSGGATVSVSSN